jgi:hypothetical protein
LVLTCILFVVKTGIVWEDLPLEFGCLYKTCKRRLKEWTKAGVWQKFLIHVLSNFRAEAGLELADVLVEAILVKGSLGRTRTDRTGGSRPLRQQIPRDDDDERTAAGCYRDRRLRIRWESNFDITQAFLDLACTIINGRKLYRKLVLS